MSALLEVADLRKWFPVRRGMIVERTVDYVKRVRLGEVDDGLFGAPATEADRRLGPVPGQGADDDEPRRPA
jgi:hypothetical protein